MWVPSAEATGGKRRGGDSGHEPRSDRAGPGWKRQIQSPNCGSHGQRHGDQQRDQVSGDGQRVQLANDNCPGQAVISGHVAAVDAAVAAAKEAGAKRAVPLAVSAPFHCSLMVPAGERLAAVLKNVSITTPRVPVVANVDATEHGEAVAVAERLVRQVSSPVLWRNGRRRLK